MRMENKTPAVRGGKTLCQELKNDNNYNIPANAPKRIIALYYFLHRSMFALEALQLYGDTCLNTTVSELSKQGYDFDRKREKHLNRARRFAYFVRYMLKPHCREKALKEIGEYLETISA